MIVDHALRQIALGQCAHDAIDVLDQMMNAPFGSFLLGDVTPFDHVTGVGAVGSANGRRVDLELQIGDADLGPGRQSVEVLQQRPLMR